MGCTAIVAHCDVAQEAVGGFDVIADQVEIREGRQIYGLMPIYACGRSPK